MVVWKRTIAAKETLIDNNKMEYLTVWTWQIILKWGHKEWKEINLEILGENVSGRLTKWERERWHQKRLER